MSLGGSVLLIDKGVTGQCGIGWAMPLCVKFSGSMGKRPACPCLVTNNGMKGAGDEANPEGDAERFVFGIKTIINLCTGIPIFL